MSWKQYGGARNLEMNRKITTNTVVADEIVLKSSYIGGFTIHGVLDVTGKGVIQGGLDVSGYINTNDISSSSIHTIQSYTSNNAFVGGNITANQNMYTGKNIIVGKDLTILNNTHIGNILYLNLNDTQFMYSNNSGIGINTIKPTATLDIHSNITQGLNVYSTQDVNRNIIAQNNLNKGIIVTADTSYSRIDFFTNNDISNNPDNPDAFIRCLSGGILELDVTTNTRIASKLSVTTRGDPTHPYNETVVIYDISTGAYKEDIYKNPDAHTGDALSLISDDSTSTSFLRIVTPEKDGIGIGGGSYALDTTRTMGMLGLFNICGEFIQNQTIVSSIDPVKYKTTIGINTYQPKTEKYVLDMNGPLHINNGDITKVAITDFQIIKMAVSPSGDLVIAAGYPSNIYDSSYGFSRLLISRDFGSTWNETPFVNSDSVHGYVFTKATNGNMPIINDIYIYDNSYAFITYIDSINLQAPKILYTTNGGVYWTITKGASSANTNYKFNKIIMNEHSFVSNKEFNLFITENINNNSNFYTVNLTRGDVSSNFTFNSPAPLKNNTIQSFDYSNFYKNFYFATNSGIYINQPPNTTFTLFLDTSMNSYNNIRCISNNIVAVGNGIISRSTDSIQFIDNYYPDISFSSIYSFNNYIFTIGNLNTIWISIDYGISFTPLWNIPSVDNISQSGTHFLITDLSNQISNIIMTDANTIILVNTLIPFPSDFFPPIPPKNPIPPPPPSSSSSVINCYFPNLCNRINNHVLDISGNMRISGDVHVNNDGKIMSTNSDFYLINENVNNVHFAENASSLSICSTTGNTLINNNLIVNLDTNLIGNLSLFGIETILNTTDSSSIQNGAFIVNGGAGISKTVNIGGNLFVNTDTTLTGKLHVISDSTLNGNLYITSLTDSSNIYTGSAIIAGGVGIQGNVNIGQHTNIIGELDVTSDTTLHGNLYITSFTDSSNIYTGSAIIAGGVGIQGNVNIGQHTNIIGELDVISDTTLHGNVYITSVTSSSDPYTGSAIIAGGVGIQGNVNIGQNMVIQQETTFYGNVDISNNLFTQGNIIVMDGVFSQKNIITNGNIFIRSDTISNDYSTGSLVVIGGVGISQDINIAGNSTITQDLTVYGNIMSNLISNTIHANGTLNIASNGDNITSNIFIGAMYDSTQPKIYTPIIIGKNNNGHILIGSTSDISSAQQIDIGNSTIETYETSRSVIQIGGKNDVINIQGASIRIGGAAVFKSSDSVYTNLSTIIQNTNYAILNYNQDYSGRFVLLNTSPDYGVDSSGHLVDSHGNVIDQSGNIYTISNEQLIDLCNNYTIDISNRIFDQSKNFVMNYVYSVNNVNYTSWGAGLWIKDFSVNNIGKLVVSQDAQGFIFKAPTYRTIFDYSGELLTGLPSQNILKLDVNNMKTNAKNVGLVTLRKNAVPFNDPDGTRYTLIGSDFDIDNIFIKVKDSISGRQIIDTDVEIDGNLYSTTNSIFNNIKANGNTVLNNLGIGTSVNPNANSLAIKGNIYQNTGGYIYQF
jgi:UDP-3-O-[3-hydroxymyristoyl] glucosamine N-acyltransferase